MDTRELIENFELFDDWQERYAYLIELGRKLPPLTDDEKRDENKVDGCLSQVWMVASGSGECVEIRAESDAAIVQGLIAVLLTVYSGKTVRQIVDTDIEAVFREIGLDSHLSPNRRNGFFSMVTRIKRLGAELSVEG